MKECPYCFKEISDTAIRCKHCRKVLSKFDIPKRKRPFIVKLLGVIAFCLALSGLLIIYILLTTELWFKATNIFKVFYCMYYCAFSVIHFLIWYGMFALRMWARKLFIFVTLYAMMSTLISIFCVTFVVSRYFNYLNFLFFMKRSFSGLLSLSINIGIIYALTHSKIVKYFET